MRRHRRGKYSRNGGSTPGYGEIGQRRSAAHGDGGGLTDGIGGLVGHDGPQRLDVVPVDDPASGIRVQGRADFDSELLDGGFFPSGQPVQGI